MRRSAPTETRMRGGPATGVSAARRVRLVQGEPGVPVGWNEQLPGPVGERGPRPLSQFGADEDELRRDRERRPHRRVRAGSPAPSPAGPVYARARPERCPSGLRSATGNRVRAERCVAGSNPALSVTVGGHPSFPHGAVRPVALVALGDGGDVLRDVLDLRLAELVRERGHHALAVGDPVDDERCRDGLASSRFGPTVPLRPASFSVWQLVQPAESKTCFPAAASPGSPAGVVSAGVVSVRRVVSAGVVSAAVALLDLLRAGHPEDRADLRREEQRADAR